MATEQQLTLFFDDDPEADKVAAKVIGVLKDDQPKAFEVPHVLGAVNPSDDVVSISTQLSNMLQLRKIEPQGTTWDDYTKVINQLYKRLEESIEYALKMPKAN